MKRVALVFLMVVVLAVGAFAEEATTYKFALVKVLVTQGRDLPMVGAVVKFMDFKTNKEATCITNKNGYVWGLLATDHLVQMTVDGGGDKFFSTKRTLIGKRNYAVTAHVSFLDNENVRFGFKKLGETLFCKLSLTIEPAEAGYTYQLIQTDVKPNVIWLDHYPLDGNGHAEVWIGKPTSWNVKVYKNGTLAGQESFSVGEKETKRGLRIKVAGGADSADGGM